MVSRILTFFKTGVWETRLKDLSPIEAFFLKCLWILDLALRGFMRDRCQKTASVLTYYSLLNVVPVVAVAFAMAKGFGLEKLIEKQILQMAAKANWQADITTQIISFSHRLLEQAKGGLITGVGIVLLLWAVISIMGIIEESLDEIWEIKRSRTLIRKFSDYMAMMVLGPVLLIISSSATVLLASQVKVIVSKIVFLGMLQMSWMIVLFGAEIAYAHEHSETFGFYPDYSRLSVSSRKLLMLRIFHLLTKKFSLGEQPLSAHQIGHTLEIPVRLVGQFLHELADVGLAGEPAKGVKGE